MQNIFYKYLATIISSFLVHSLAFGQSYVYRPYKSESKISSIKFNNGESIIITKSGDYNTSLKFTKNGSLKHESPPFNRYLQDHDNGTIYITAAYPNATNPIVAVIESYCTGTACNWTDYYFAYILNGKLRLDNLSMIDDKKSYFKIDVSNKSSPKILAMNVPDGGNEFGDTLYSSKKLLSGIGFVDVKFDYKYVKLVGAHSDSLLSNEKWRGSFATKLGMERFRELRSCMSGSRSSRLVQTRYLIFDGCMSVHCGYCYGSVMLDGISGDIWAIWMFPDEKKVDAGTSASWDSLATFVFSIESEFSSDYDISANKGILAIKKK